MDAAIAKLDAAVRAAGKTPGAGGWVSSFFVSRCKCARIRVYMCSALGKGTVFVYRLFAHAEATERAVAQAQALEQVALGLELAAERMPAIALQRVCYPCYCCCCHACVVVLSVFCQFSSSFLPFSFSPPVGFENRQKFTSFCPLLYSASFLLHLKQRLKILWQENAALRRELATKQALLREQKTICATFLQQLHSLRVQQQAALEAAM